MRTLKKGTLICMILCCILLLSGCSATDGVEKKIDSIGDVTLEKKEAIEDAEAAYAALTSENQAKVSNYEILQSARTQYDYLAEQKAKTEKDESDAYFYSQKIITKMGSIFNSPLNVKINGIWYYHSSSDSTNFWTITFQLSVPNGYGNYIDDYYTMSLYNDDFDDLDSVLDQERQFWLVLGSGVKWQSGEASAMQFGTKLPDEKVQSIQDYYLKNVR